MKYPFIHKYLNIHNTLFSWEPSPLLSELPIIHSQLPVFKRQLAIRLQASTFLLSFRTSLFLHPQMSFLNTLP